jgi:glycosyltransferase involved in cell wall biosynthesis
VRVLFATPAGLARGGVATVLEGLAAELVARGHSASVLSPGRSPVLERAGERFGLPARELRLQLPLGTRRAAASLPLFGALFPPAFLQLLLFLKSSRIDLVNVHYPSAPFVYFALCRRLLRVALVTSIHGADLFPAGDSRADTGRALRVLLSRSDLVVAPSHGHRALFAGAFPELRDRARVVHAGIDVDWWRSATESARGAGAAHRPPYVVSVSAYKEQKGLDVLLRAFRRLTASHPELRLALCGDGHLRPELERLALDLGIASRVDFAGPRTRAEVAGLLAGARAFVLPSRFETFGIAILEALASGVPVVATRAGGIPEIVTDGHDGLLIDAEDDTALAHALDRLLGGDAMARRLADNGLRTVRDRFTLARAGAAYEAAFVEALGRTRGACLRAARPVEAR